MLGWISRPLTRPFVFWVVILAFCVAITLLGQSAAFCRNLGWIALARGLEADADHAVPYLLTAQQWFSRVQSLDDKDTPNYGWYIAALGLPKRTSTSMSDWDKWQRTPRGQVHLASALHYAMRLVDQVDWSAASRQAGQTSNWGQANERVTRYDVIASARKPDLDIILRFIALDIADSRMGNVAFWEQQIRMHYPGQAYAWLYDTRNPYARIALAEILYKLGRRNEAILIGEQAVSSNHWHWGHYVMAGIYLREAQLTEAENHLQLAILYGREAPMVARYRVELADFYRGQDKVSAAKEQYCAVITGMPGKNPDNIDWYAKAVAELSSLEGQSDYDLALLCSIP